MAAVERLTKQNHDLEKQLHQRDAGPNVQEENQQGNNAKRRDQEKLEGSNALSWLEQQNISLPFLMDFAPQPIITEMQAMKEQMEVIMNAFKGWVSTNLDDLVNRTDSPFTTSVTSFPLPSKFQMPHIESYDGVKDPLDHLKTLKTLMHFQGVPDKIIVDTLFCNPYLTSHEG